MLYNLFDTIVAISTPRGVGGVGIVRLSGTKSYNISHVISKKKINIGINHSYIFNKDNSILDHCLIIFFKTPKSFTGEDVIEIHLHGNDLILDKVVSMCIEYGARLAEAGEFSLRSYLNSKIDLIQAEAINSIIKSTSLYSNRFILKSLIGSFSKEINFFLDKVNYLKLSIESSIEFPDTIYFDFNDFYLTLNEINNLYLNFVKRVSFDSSFFDSLNIIILGNVNVGKSSLFNLLLNRDRSIVSNIPGTTRDFIDSDLFINGIKFKLVDTAGFNFSSNDYIEKLSIEKTLNQSRNANILIFMEDVTINNELGNNEFFDLVLNECVNKFKIIFFKNKIDLINMNKKIFFHPNYVEIFGSVKNKDGIDLLINELSSTFLYVNENFYFISKRNFDILLKIKNHFDSLLISDDNIYKSLDLYAEHINIIHSFLSELIGIDVSDDILKQIFSNFCVGK